MKTRKPLGNRGFSLVEILVAVAILGFVILGMLWADKGKWSILARADRANQALRQIEQHIETRRITTITSGALPAAGSETPAITREGITLRDEVGESLDIDGNPQENVRTLTVWATWQGAPTPIRIQTRLAKDF